MNQIITHFGDNSRSVRCPFYVGNDREISEQNKSEIAQILGILGENVVIGNQRHGNAVKVITQENKTEQHEADALITQEQDIALGVVTADCLPILIHDVKNRVIATIHAGWKGLRDGIIENTIQKIFEISGVKSEDIRVQIGPHISGENYEVGEEFREYFPEDIECFEEHNEKLYFSLGKRARKILKKLGVKPENISVSEICTFENAEKYFSFRKKTIMENEIQRASGNNISYIMMR